LRIVSNGKTRDILIKKPPNDIKTISVDISKNAKKIKDELENLIAHSKKYQGSPSRSTDSLSSTFSC